MRAEKNINPLAMAELSQAEGGVSSGKKKEDETRTESEPFITEFSQY